MVIAILYQTPKLYVPEVKECFSPLDVYHIKRGSLVWTDVTGHDLPKEIQKKFGDVDLEKILGYTPAMFYAVAEMVMGGDCIYASTASGKVLNLSPMFSRERFYELTDYERLVRLTNSVPRSITLNDNFTF